MQNAYPTPAEVFGTDTIPAALERAAATGRGITLIDRSLNEQYFSYADLAETAKRVASAVRRLGVSEGDRVCLLSSTDAALVQILFGVWRAGAVPIILPLPRRITELEAYVEDLAVRVKTSGAALVVAAEIFLEQDISLDSIPAPIVGPSDLLSSTDPIDGPIPCATGDVALLQFTSGTTARSRAVTLTHHQVMINMASVGVALDIEPDRDVIVSWLPMFHDMGLIGLFLGAVFFGVSLVLEPTEEFLARPGSWIDAISKYGGTVTASPNFGYGLAARDMLSKPRELDLSTWRIAANGAEPVDIDTIDTFTQAAAPHGFRAETMCPMYGLAEATLGVAVSPDDELPQVYWADRDALEKDKRAVQVEEGSENAKPLVVCGRAIPGMEISIRRPDGQVCAPGEVGEICLRSESVMEGYWQDPDGTAEVIQDGWLRTGDLGFLTETGVVICGRVKDMIILGGRNLYPEDYEFWTERVPGVRRGNVIAFALPEAERMVVVAETTVGPDQAQLVAKETLITLRKKLPRGPEEVVLVAPGTLPKTSSGKRQRGAARERYREGGFDVVAVAKR